MQNEVLTENQSRSRRFAPLGIIFGLLGLLLFAYFVSRAGVGEILSNIQRLGAGFVLILAVSSIRYIVRALAWTRCIEPPHRLPFRSAFAARLMGDALGNIIPFVSVAVSEADHRVPPGGTNFNFIEEFGVGATYRLSDNCYFIGGVRYFHLSNAHLHGADENPSLNGMGYYVGLMWTFK